jgi:5'-nucleotidase
VHFLVTNDDGVNAPGIAALAKVAARFGRVTVAAPMQGVSSCSHHVTTHRDVEVKEVRSGWFAIDGYPADCVRVALTVIAQDIDVVLSGINDGGNLGMDLLMSGTASAAREAVIRGKRGIAVSQYKARRGDANWQRASAWTEIALAEVLTRAALGGAFWNINLPDPVGEVPQPSLVECDYDNERLPVGFEYAEGKWRYVSRYQSRAKNPGRDIDLCFGGAITLSAVRCFQ